MAICPICVKKVERGDKALCCALCHNFFHSHCLKMESEDYEFCKENFMWKCKVCISNARINNENLILSPSLSINKQLPQNISNNSPLLINEIADNSKIKNNCQSDLNEETKNVYEYVNLKLNALAESIQETKKLLLDKFDSMEENLLSTINALNHENVKLKSEIVSLSARLNNLEQSSLNNSIDIVGFPLMKNKDKLRESLLDFFCDTLQTNISNENIIMCNQNKIINTDDNKTNSIVNVKFDSIFKKNIVMSAKKKLKDNPVPFLNEKGIEEKNDVYLNHSLTKNNRTLFNAAKKTKDNYKLKHLWISFGKILMRASDESEIKLIKSEEDLNFFRPTANLTLECH